MDTKGNSCVLAFVSLWFLAVIDFFTGFQNSLPDQRFDGGACTGGHLIGIHRLNGRAEELQ
jgi:hypothetical protein